MATRILIVDDHPIMQRGLRVTLESEPDLQVVGVAESAEDALAMLDETAPDLALVDISLPGMGGLELIRHLLTRRPNFPILVVSRHDDDLYAERVVRAGARGYISKVEAADCVVEAVQHIRLGGLYIRDEIKDRMLSAAPQKAGRDPLTLLSDRELEVYERIGYGESAREIAEAMALSVKTIETYRARIKDKLGLDSARSLLRHATRWAADHPERSRPRS